MLVVWGNNGSRSVATGRSIRNQSIESSGLNWRSFHLLGKFAEYEAHLAGRLLDLKVRTESPATEVLHRGV
jgi:hypothetical protein